MVTVVHSSPDREVQALALGDLVGDTVLCSLARYFIPAVPISTQVNKWVEANVMLGRTDVL